VSSTASQAGENDQTNVVTQRSFQAFSTYPTLKRSRRRRTAPSDPSLNQPPSRQSPAACPERPYSSRTFTNLNNSLNCESKEWLNKFIDIPSSFEILNQNFAENLNNELNRAESEFSKSETRNRLPGRTLVLILQQIKPNHSTLTLLREKYSEATTEEE
jgi:hypothetical protein